MLTVELRDRGLQRALDRLGDLDTRKVAEIVGAVVESQTRRRIHEEKTTPDGEAWPEWSPAYAKAQEGASGTMLERSGAMLDSIGYTTRRDAAVVSSPLIYAGPMDEQRTFLGVGEAHKDEIVEAIEDFMRKAVAA